MASWVFVLLTCLLTVAGNCLISLATFLVVMTMTVRGRGNPKNDLPAITLTITAWSVVLLSEIIYSRLKKDD